MNKFKLYFATSQITKHIKKSVGLQTYNRDFLDPAEIDE